MSKKSNIYTKTGDDGTTGLVGGSRIKKYNLRLESYGTIDELNSWIGMIRSFEIPKNINDYLIEIQNKLFNIGSRLASDKKGDAFTAKLSITKENILFLENAIDVMETDLPELSRFILPGGDLLVSYCHVARTVCRRAERRIVEFSEQEMIQTEIIKYINRLSDFLFVLARKTAALHNVDETHWNNG